MSEMGVSIICNAYNHEKYIRKTLEGFVCQKTTFPIEVLIHDDASTDATAQIIREYEEKYPDIIKPIYQTVNQYRRVDITREFQIPRERGKYIAMCEGDDYWTDPYKLQKQFDALEAHPDVDICAHRAVRVNADTEEVLAVIAPANQNTILSPANVILGGGAYVATNSLMYRAKLDRELPEFRVRLTLDYTLQIQGSLRGGMLYLNDCMSAYRWMSIGSWTSQTFASISRLKVTCEKVSNMLREVDKATNYVHNDAISKRLLIENVAPWNTVRENRKVLKNNKEVFKKLKRVTKIKLVIKAHLPMVFRMKQKIELLKK